MRTYTIAALPGDGIGTEVMDSATEVLEVLGEIVPDLAFRVEEFPIGLTALEATGEPLPASTIEGARAADGVLHGATDGARIPARFRAPITGLRHALDAYASVRPSMSHPGLEGATPGIDLVVVRETTEGLYSKIEYMVGPDVACTVRTVTRRGTERITRKAFELARQRRKLVTVAHKRAGLPLADAFMLDVVHEVAAEYPDVELHEGNIDALAQELVLRPERFDVILAENQYGDILSDVASAVTGGLGLAASGCIGDRWAYFEPVHGSAPDIAGKNLANPSAMLLATAMMLDHLGESAAGDLVRSAVVGVLDDGTARTGDLGGQASTTDVTQAVITRLRASS